MYHNSHTHTRTSGRSCSRVYMDVCTCVYVCHKCTWACMCIHTSISHIYILTQTRIPKIYAYNMYGKRPMYACTMIHTYKHIHEWPLMQSCLYGCVYLCTSLSQCVCVYVSVLNLYTLTQMYHTQYTYTTYMQRGTCLHIPQFIHTRMSGHSCSVSVWMNVRVYVCCTCVYVHHNAFTYVCTLHICK